MPNRPSPVHLTSLPVWDHVSGKRNRGVPKTSKAPNDLLGIPSPWVRYDRPCGLFPWWTTSNLGHLVLYTFGSLIKLSDRLGTSKHVSTLSVMPCIGLGCVCGLYGWLGIKGYPVVVWVCCLKYTHGVVLPIWFAMCMR